MKRLIVYARVSTDEQAGNYSLQTQIERCREWADQHGYQVVAEISDDYTGTTMDRPGLNQVIEMIEDGEADALISYAPDRLSRNLVHRGILRDELSAKGIELITVTRGVYKPNPSNRFVDNIEGAVAEYELDLIRERTSRGRRAKAEEGIVLGQGMPPYGYQKVGEKRNTRFVVDPEEAEIVKNVFKWFVVGDGQGPISVTNIAFKLDGNPTREDKLRTGRKRMGDRKWSRVMIYRILKNVAYTGNYYAYRWKNVDGRTIQRDKEDWIPIRIPPIVSEELFYAAQDRLKQGKRKSGVTRSKGKCLVMGRIKCRCGYTMSTRSNKSKYSPRRFYYRCNATQPRWTSKECRMESFRADVVDGLVWEWFADLISDPQLILEGLDEARESAKNKNKQLYGRAEVIDNQIQDAKKQINSLLDLYMNDNIPRDMLDDRISGLNIKIDKLEAEKEQTISRMGRVISDEQITEISHLSALISDKMTDVDFKTKRAMIDIVDLSVMGDEQDGTKILHVSCFGIEDILELGYGYRKFD